MALQKNGKNYLGLCPFHGEKTPSFNVVEDKQFYHCFGCGKSGDVFKFLEEFRGISFKEAFNILADRIGLNVRFEETSVSQPKKVVQHQALYDIHEDAARFYHAILTTTTMGQKARDYLYERGLTDDVISHFRIGLAPQEGASLYERIKDKYSEKDLYDSGLFNLTDQNRFYDAFHQRIIFPLSDQYGRVIAFSGRIWLEGDSQLDQGAKYKNSRTTPIFNKSRELYHLDGALPRIKKNREVYIMEGFMDVIAAYRAGIENAVASMGTALTAEHVEHLSQFSKQFILAYDGDKAGQKAISKALEILANKQVQVLRFPDNLDPDEYLKKYSTEELALFMSQTRISKVEFLLDYLRPDFLESLQSQIDFVDQMAPLIAQDPSVTAQNSYIYMLADSLSYFDYNQVEDAVNRIRLSQRSQTREIKRQEVVERQSAVRPLPVTRLIKAENTLLYRMFTNPHLLNEYRLNDSFSFVTEELQQLYLILCQQGQVDPATLSSLDEKTQAAWYRMLESDLPDDYSSEEINEVELIREKELLKMDALSMGKNVRKASSEGNIDLATQELERLIAQRRRME